MRFVNAVVAAGRHCRVVGEDNRRAEGVCLLLHAPPGETIRGGIGHGGGREEAPGMVPRRWRSPQSAASSSALKGMESAAPGRVTLMAEALLARRMHACKGIPAISPAMK